MEGNKFQSVEPEKKRFDAKKDFQCAFKRLPHTLLFMLVYIGNYVVFSSIYQLENGAVSSGFIMAVTGIYLVPAAVADERKHRDKLAIVVFNLLLGWTFVGWVAALVWALTNQKKE